MHLFLGYTQMKFFLVLHLMMTFELEFTLNLTFEITTTDLDYDLGDHLDLIPVHLTHQHLQ